MMVDGFASGAGGKYAHAATFQNAAQREDVPHIVIDDQHFLPDQGFIGTMQAIEHDCLSSGRSAMIR